MESVAVERPRRFLCPNSTASRVAYDHCCDRHFDGREKPGELLEACGGASHPDNVRHAR